MDKKSPLFSIIMPTRNRARLLRYALQSALDQTFDDYEIVVSDNRSADNTAEVVKELRTSRVRYIQPDQILSMPDHWEFALQYAEGQYITYLCDDDALCPNALEKVVDAIGHHKSDLLVLGSGIYYGDNWLDKRYQNSLEIRPYTGKTRECNSRDTLTHLFQCWDTYDVPRMENSFCHSEIINQLRAEYKKIFLLVPDYSFAAFSLGSVPMWTYIDEPLRLQGVFAEGIGATMIYNRGNSSREFMREFKCHNLLERVPLKSPLTTNFIAEALLMVKETMGSKLADVDIDWGQYFMACWDRIVILESTGVNVTADKKEFFQVLSEQPNSIEFKVKTVISKSSPSLEPYLKKIARTIINNSSTLKRFKYLLRHEGKKEAKSFIIQGNESGFSNIAECAEKLESLRKNVIY